MSKLFEPVWLYKKGADPVLCQTQEDYDNAKNDGFGDHENVAKARQAALNAIGGEDDALKLQTDRVEKLEADLATAKAEIDVLNSIINNGKAANSKQVEQIQAVEKERDDLKAENSRFKERVAFLESKATAADLDVSQDPSSIGGSITMEEVFAASDAALKLAKENDVDLKDVKPSNGRNITKPDVEAFIAARSAA